MPRRALHVLVGFRRGTGGRLRVVCAERGSCPVSGLVGLLGQPIAPASRWRAGKRGRRVAGRVVCRLRMAGRLEPSHLWRDQSVPDAAEGTAARLDGPDCRGRRCGNCGGMVRSSGFSRSASLPRTVADCRLKPGLPNAVCLLGGFLLFHVLAVIMAHCIYRMGEAVQSFRFYVAVYWIGLWLAALYGRTAWRPAAAEAAEGRGGACRRGGRVRRVAGRRTAAAGALVLGASERPSSRQEETSPTGMRWHGWEKESPRTSWCWPIAWKSCGCSGTSNARCVPDIKYGQAPLTWSEIGQAGKDGRLWGIVVWNDDLCREGRFGDALRELVFSPGKFPQLRKLETGSRMSVWEFVPERSSSRSA